MNHPELIAVPALMLADNVLTILGAQQSAAVYRNHFKIPSYELNPIWRDNVDRIQWFNLRHIASVVVVTGLLVLLDQILQSDDPSEMGFMLLLGMLFGAFGSICGSHLTNLLTFHYVNSHPGEISGEVFLSMKLVLKLSLFKYIGIIPLFLFVVVFAPNQYTFGMLLGLLSVVFAHFVWARKANSAESKS